MSTYSDMVIVGGSVAATRAAEAARRHAPSLTVTVVSAESHLPYERPPLSKLPLGEPVDLDELTYPAALRLQEEGVKFALDTRADGLDIGAKQVSTNRGTIGYGALVIATGCEPILPPMLEGLPDVYVLRSYEDAVALRRAVAEPGRSVAVIGAGFIGGEFAATLVKEGHEVTLVDLAAKPLGRFGDAVADAYERLHLGNGVDLELGTGAVGTVGASGSRSLELADGTLIPADVIVVGVGVRPSVAWLDGSGLTIENGIVCDETLRAGDGSVFAAGDAVRWPNPRYGETMRIEHWTTAAEQGRIAGINAANSLLGGELKSCAPVPYFWSDQHGVRIQYAGHRTGAEQVVEHHDQDGSLYLYRCGDEAVAVLAFEMRPVFVRLRAALRNGLFWEQACEIAGLGEPDRVASR
ncbi:NAD(P)/FAD-dependent oxidoreductase [Nocardia fusca]|uniref:NAD(P)/FAD-dependent oxidoreductase n=1 Tax=Nocardia fusca TaxID=941183 RepID=UPI0037A9A95E